MPSRNEAQQTLRGSHNRPVVQATQGERLGGRSASGASFVNSSDTPRAYHVPTMHHVSAVGYRRHLREPVQHPCTRALFPVVQRGLWGSPSWGVIIPPRFLGG